MNKGSKTPRSPNRTGKAKGFLFDPKTKKENRSNKIFKRKVEQKNRKNSSIEERP